MINAVEVFLYAIFIVMIIYLLILLHKSKGKAEKKFVAERITNETETGVLLFSFKDKEFVKRTRRGELCLYLGFFLLPLAYYAEVGTVSREEIYEMLAFPIMINLVLFVALRMIAPVRLIEVFSAGIKITHGPKKVFSTEFREQSSSRFYHFANNDFSEYNESEALIITFLNVGIVIDSPETIKAIVEAYERFNDEKQ